MITSSVPFLPAAFLPTPARRNIGKLLLTLLLVWGVHWYGLHLCPRMATVFREGCADEEDKVYVMSAGDGLLEE